ncbi:MAG: adenosylcobinamide-GDP ribazoletransferase [Pseudomonadota bacterium]
MSTATSNTGQTHLAYFLAAVMFYTRLPVPESAAHSEHILNKSRIYFPVIGWIVGALAILVFWLANQVLPTSVSVLLSMIATILVTGAFHEDGFADSCDGLGGGWQTEQVLTIMKDSRVGTYAVVGLILILGLKLLALMELAQHPFWLFALIYLAAHTISRLYSSLVIEVFDYVQDIDASKVKPITDRRLEPTEIAITTCFTALPVLLLLIAWTNAVIALLSAALMAWGFARYSAYRIGGYTGDILGAVQQLSEVVFLVAMLALVN